MKALQKLMDYVRDNKTKIEISSYDGISFTIKRYEDIIGESTSIEGAAIEALKTLGK